MNIEKKTRTSFLSTPSDNYYRWVAYGIVTLHDELNSIPIQKQQKSFSLAISSKRIYVMWNNEEYVYWIFN